MRLPHRKTSTLVAWAYFACTRRGNTRGFDFLATFFVEAFFLAAIVKASYSRVAFAGAARCRGVTAPVWVSGLMEANGAIVASQSARPRARSVDTSVFTVEPLPF